MWVMGRVVYAFIGLRFTKQLLCVRPHSTHYGHSSEQNRRALCSCRVSLMKEDSRKHSRVCAVPHGAEMWRKWMCGEEKGATQTRPSADSSHVQHMGVETWRGYGRELGSWRKVLDGSEGKQVGRPGEGACWYGWGSARPQGLKQSYWEESERGEESGFVSAHGLSS